MLADEPVPLRPEVAVVFFACALARDTERLAGATTCPNRSVVAPSGPAQRDRPEADPREEVALRVAFEVIRLHFLNGAGVNIPRCNQPILD